MSVFIVQYEGGYILGVFSTYEKATEWFNHEYEKHHDVESGYFFSNGKMVTQNGDYEILEKKVDEGIENEDKDEKFLHDKYLVRTQDEKLGYGDY